MKQCRFCGGKILDDAHQCKHCGKTLRESKSNAPESTGLTNIDSWEKKSIPSWLMYAVVGFFAMCVVLLIVKGCETPEKKPAKDETAALQIWNAEAIT